MLKLNSKITIPVFILLLFFSCTNHRKGNTGDSESVRPYPHVINMNEGFKNAGQIKLSDIADSIRYIVLSEDKKVLLGNVQNIQMSDSNIYIKSNNLVYRFDLSGNLLNSFGSVGRGPAEYLPGSIYTLTPDFKKVIILRNMMYEYLLYKTDGELIGKRDYPHNRNLFSFVSISDSAFMVTFYYAGNFMTEDYLKTMPGIAGLFDLRFKPIAVIENPLKNKKLSGDEYKRIAISNSSFTFFNNRIILTPDGDTIYEIDKNSIKPGFIINWGNLPHKEGVEDLYFRQAGPSNKVINYKPVLETTTKSFFRGGSAGNFYLFEYNKANGTSRSMDLEEYNSGFINDLDGGSGYFPDCTNRAGDIWIAEEDAFDFKAKHNEEFMSKTIAIHPEMREKLRTFLIDLKPDDNPVLKIVYLKKH